MTPRPRMTSAFLVLAALSIAALLLPPMLAADGPLSLGDMTPLAVMAGLAYLGFQLLEWATGEGLGT